MTKLLTGLLCLCLFVVCSGAGAQPRATVTVFAAASLTEALKAVDAAYTHASGTAVRESFASSSTLARQIEAGAPADVFVSADREWMDYLGARGLIGSQAMLLGNALALVAPAGSPVKSRVIGSNLDWLRLLGADGRLAVGDPDHVPAGIYAKESLQRLGVWHQVEPRLARAEDVRGALALVERADTPLGIVYVTDARASDGVKIVGIFPAATHAPIVYPAAIVRGSETPAAKSYFRFLCGAAARRIFTRFGFTEP
jgi:molybdate transport system substrate-binding protein